MITFDPVAVVVSTNIDEPSYNLQANVPLSNSAFLHRKFVSQKTLHSTLLRVTNEPIRRDVTSLIRRFCSTKKLVLLEKYPFAPKIFKIATINAIPGMPTKRVFTCKNYIG